MNKADLVDQVAATAGLERKQAAEAVRAMLAVIAGTLAADGEVTLTGFGKFHVTERCARPGVNPRTGESIQIAMTRVPRFTAGSALKKAVRS